MLGRSREPPSWPGPRPQAGFVDADWQDRIAETTLRRDGPYVFRHTQVGRPPLATDLFRCARKHGCHTFRIDVEGQEYQRLVAWVSPLVHEGVRFIDQGTWSPCLCLTVDRVRTGAGNNIVQSRS